MDVRLIRHATLLVELGGRTILVDPMLDPKDARPPIPDTEPERRNPLVDLPLPAEELVAAADAVLVTHLHADHFDETAARLVDGLPVWCQPGDEDRIPVDASPVADTVAIGPVTVTRTGGRHGFGDLGAALGPVCGFVLEHEDERLYIAGDTVWCDEVEQAIAAHRPTAIVVNAGGARFVGSDRIVMDVDDVRRVRSAAPDAHVIAVHLEAINHCPVTRAELRAIGVDAPDDGAVATG